MIVLICMWVSPALGVGENTQEEEKTSENNAAVVTPKTRFRLGGISLEGVYRHYSNGDYFPGYYPYLPYYPAFLGPPAYYYGWSDYSFSQSPYHPGFYNGFSRSPGMGEVRLRTSQKSAEVFIDGAYAGLAEDLKDFWLEPGAYNLEIKGEGNSFQRRVYVLSGKTVRINATLRAEKEGVKP